MTSNASEKCPVDHSASKRTCPVDHGEAVETTDACPVDHSSRSTWTNLFGTNATASSSTAPPTLPVDRETSSIPRNESENWVYPSQAQFFAAMARKKHNPRESDMKVIVPIHNAVNERAWGEVMKWEQGQGGESCGGVKLVSFKGRPGDRSPRARLNMLLGYQAPFDRHDWVVDRCGTRIRYVIDFYTGRSAAGSANPSFFLDVRPALDNWEGVRMRVGNWWDRWFGGVLSEETRARSISSPSPTGSTSVAATSNSASGGSSR
ncbi:cytochrome C1 heme lyase [Schizopora paradoxa]|uniref:Holocytochrome c-type synthase n=1 Tax=Schizopora paradoxa TaxID=27342 RepID=A0A0H2SBE6_9AGAM|nr:cytochrome C1 heme lyase [Schizopora paradoxa]